MNLFPATLNPAWLAGLKTVASRCGSCHKLVVLRKFSAHRAGIKMHGSWYCSARCFTAAVQQEIVRLRRSGGEPASHVPRMPLGLSLMRSGLLTAEQLKNATEEQKDTGGDIAEILVRQGSVSEKQVTDIRSAEWGCPVFTLPRDPVQTGIQIPTALLEAYSMVPVHYVAASNLLLVGFVHGIDYGILYTLEQLTGCKTKPCFVTPSAFQIKIEQTKQLQKAAQKPSAKELDFDHVKTPEKIAHVLCDTGLKMEADEALLAKCGEYLWARLKNGHKSVDLLFKVG